VTFGLSETQLPERNFRRIRFAADSMEHSQKHLQMRERRCNSEKAEQSDSPSLRSQGFEDSVVDVASRRFRRRGEVGRTKPPHVRSERGPFGSLTHCEARPSEWPGPFKRQHAAVRPRVQSDWVHFWAGPGCSTKCSMCSTKMFHVEPGVRSAQDCCQLPTLERLERLQLS
jgi:hypothetical protein